MRIAVTSALSWPFIRRGNRCAWEQAVHLAGRGHEVTFITPTPGRHAHTEEQDGVRVEYVPLAEGLLLSALKLQKLASFAPRCAAVLGRVRPDVVQATYPVDACAADLHRRRSGTPFTYLIYDCNPFHNEFLFGRMLFARGARGAGVRTAISRYVAEALAREWGLSARTIHLPVDTAQFPCGPDKDPASADILCTASLLDPRKRVELLVAAFARLAPRVPTARLRLSGLTDDRRSAQLLALLPAELRPRVEILGLGRRQDVPAQYRDATLSVLPSVNEAFGLVLVESLASGTYVVGADSGAIPEVLDDEAHGKLFAADGGPDALAAAIEAALPVARARGTAARCRAAVERRWTWDVIGPIHEAIYEELVGARAGRVTTSAPGPGEASAGAPRASAPRAAAPRAAPVDALAEPERALHLALDAAGTPTPDWFAIDGWLPGASAVARALGASGGAAPAAVLVPGAGPGARAVGLLLAAAGRQVALHAQGRRFSAVALVLDAAEPDPDASLRDALAALAPTGTLALLVASADAAPDLRARLAAEGLSVSSERRLQARRPVERGWGSPSVRAALALLPGRAARAALPPLRRARLLLAQRGSIG